MQLAVHMGCELASVSGDYAEEDMRIVRVSAILDPNSDTGTLW